MTTYFPSQAEKFVLVRIPDVTLSLLNHFPSRTLLTLHTDLLLVCLIQSWVHCDLSRITGVLFGQNKAEYSTPYACPLVKTGERLLKGYFKQCLKVRIHENYAVRKL